MTTPYHTVKYHIDTGILKIYIQMGNDPELGVKRIAPDRATTLTLDDKMMSVLDTTIN